MAERSDFHESYYDHTCAIIPQKDVLQTDITGHSVATSLKRWWNDLFLLSYTDRRSQVYFTSSHAMRMERVKQYRRYRSRIHPFSKFRNFWDCLMMIVFICNKFLFHHNTSVIFGPIIAPLHNIAVAVEAIILLDLIVNLQTGYANKEVKKVILNPNKGFLQYCSNKLFVHCASAIPLQTIMFLRYGTDINCALCKTNFFMCTLRILNIFSLYRVYESTEYLIRARDSSRTTHVYKFLRIIVFGFITMLQFYDFSDTVGLINILRTGEVDYSSHYSRLLVARFALSKSSAYKLICYNFARISKSLLLFTFGYSRSRFYMDKMFTLVAYIISNIFYTWCLLECYAFMNWLKFPEDQVIINKNMTLNLVYSRQLPDKVCQKVKQYYDFKMTNVHRVRMTNGLYHSLPKILKKEAAFACYKNNVMRVHYFANWPMDVIEAMVLILKEEIYLRDDVVAESWVSGNGLVIVHVGELAVYSAREEETGHLIDGDYFGELSLVTDKEVRTSHVIAITSCKVLVLGKLAFRKLMRKYPELFFSLKDHLKRKFSNSGEVEGSENESVM